jgi:asparagine synthetase B (glutamine-hydrolysing)
VVRAVHVVRTPRAAPGYGALRSLGQYERCQGDHLRRMLYVDCHTWLADNLLERGDRMSMAASIENRPPFLDHELVELAFRIDSSMKVKGKSGKWIVKEIARRICRRTSSIARRSASACRSTSGSAAV